MSQVEITADLSTASDQELVAIAHGAAPEPRPTSRYPHWRYCIEQYTPTDELNWRLNIWTEFKRRGLTSPVLIPWSDGLTLSVTLGNDLSRCTYVCRSFEPNEFAFIAEYLRPGMTVIDVGANEGTYTIFMAKHVGPTGRVIAFEPSQREHARLRANIEVNALRNVKAHQIGVSDAQGNGLLRIAEAEHAGLNTLGTFLYATDQASVDEIYLRTLDDVISEEGIDKVDFIKIDVEGAEMQVLRGAKNSITRFKPMIQLEMFEGALKAQGADSTEVLRFLQEMGYRFYDFGGETGRPEHFQPGIVVNSNLLAAPQHVAI